MRLHPLLFAVTGLSFSCAVDEEPAPDVSETQAAVSQLYKRHPTARGLMPADYDGDQLADIAFRRENGIWAFDYASNGFGGVDAIAGGRGGLDALPGPADYDGGGFADVAIYSDDGAFVVEYAEERPFTDPTRPWPQWSFWSDDIPGGGYRLTGTPVPANYDGDLEGRDDRALLTSTGEWIIDYSGTGPAWDVVLSTATHPGLLEGYPAPADYGSPGPQYPSGMADVAIKDLSGNWKIDYAENGFGGWEATFDSRGGAWSIPVPGHYDDDGIADLAVKADDGYWLIDYSNNGFGPWDEYIPGHGDGSVTPVPADYDGDGNTDIAIQVPCGTWYIDYSANGYGPWDDYVQTTDVSAPQNRRTVTTASELHALLRSEFLGMIDIPAGLTLDFTDIAAGNRLSPEDPTTKLPMVISSCVRISGPANPLAIRPLLKSDDDEPTAEPNPDTDMAPGYDLFEIRGDGAHLQWVHVRGPAAGRRHDNLPFFTGVGIRLYPGRGDRNIRVENSELDEWPGAAVAVTAQRGHPDPAWWGPAMTSADGEEIRVGRNWIHRNAEDGQGYGVLVDQGAYVRIERNVFDRNRHAISSSGVPFTGYMASENYVLEGGYTEGTIPYWNQHFDVHGTGPGGYDGTGGEYFEVTRNAFRGEQDYQAIRTRPAFMMRGTPTIGAWFFNNVAVHDDCGEAVRLKDGNSWDLVYEEIFRVHCEPDNRFNVDNSTDLGVGDFDGDGFDDVFLGTGVTWWYSAAGSTEWKFLNVAQERASQLEFAHVDTDGRTDVIAEYGQWLYWSSGGTGPWQFLAGTFPDAPLAKLHIADFDADNRADLFRTTGTHWWLWSSRTQLWTPTRAVTMAFEDMRFGQFDDWNGADVIARIGTRWYLSSGSTGPWVQHDSVYRVASLRSTVVADFNGDGRSDLAWRSGNTWVYSRTGKGTPFWLRTIAPMPTCDVTSAGTPPTPPACPTYSEINTPTVLLGRFDPWYGADAVVMEREWHWNGFSWENPYDIHLAWWNGLENGFTRLSQTEMR